LKKAQSFLAPRFPGTLFNQFSVELRLALDSAAYLFSAPGLPLRAFGGFT
jgi:hypothetical protein